MRRVPSDLDRAPRRGVRTLGALGTLGAAWAAIGLSGRRLALPAASDLARPTAWVDRVGTEVAAATALRAVAVGLLTWVTVTALLGVVARRLRSARTVRTLDRVTLPAVRRAAELVAGVAVVATSIASGPVAGATTRPVVAATAEASPTAAAPDLASPTMRDLGPLEQAPTTDRPAPTAPRPLAGPDDPADPGGPSPGRPDPPPAASAAAVAPTVPDTWTIRPGDTLWHVAESTLADRRGRPASPTEVAGLLGQIVAANADRLAVPGDPDLVFPGQRFVVP